MAEEKRVSASEKRPCDIANLLEINNLATGSLCLPVAEFRAAGSGSGAEFGKGFKSRFCMHITLPPQLKRCHLGKPFTVAHV
jgi:hypothetical protein